MGRIAEALKRAQQEREHRLRTGAPAWPESAAGGSQTGDSRIGRGGTPAASTREPLAESFVKIPPLRKPFSVTAKPLGKECVDPRILAFHDPSCAIAEKYRSVRTRLLTNNPSGSARIHAVTSTLRQEGRTVTVANLAFSLAELRHLRVAMIDLDFRQRGLTRMLQCENRPGAADVLRCEKRLADVCIPVARENLHLIPAGHLGEAGPNDLLAGDPVSELFREIGERYHYALVDTPPVHTCADIGLIGPLCHSVLVVIRMNRTPEPLLLRSVKMLQANHMVIAGCILAGVNNEAMSLNDGQELCPGGLH